MHAQFVQFGGTLTCLSDGKEVVQERALETIYPGVSYSRSMEKFNVQTRFDRRGLCKVF